MLLIPFSLIPVIFCIHEFSGSFLLCLHVNPFQPPTVGMQMVYLNSTKNIIIRLGVPEYNKFHTNKSGFRLFLYHRFLEMQGVNLNITGGIDNLKFLKNSKFHTNINGFQ